MIIGIDASRANNLQKTGVEWYAFSLIIELKKIIPGHHQVRLYTREKLRMGLEDLPKNWEERVLHWMPKYLWTQIRLSFEMIVHPPDLLFIPAHVMPIASPKRVIMTIHDLAFIRVPKSYSWKENWYQRFIVRFAADKASHIIVPSESTKKDLINFDPVSEKKISVIYNGFDKNNFQRINDLQSIASLLTKHVLRSAYFLSIGRLETKKNTLRMIKAFEIFRDYSKQNEIPAYQLLLVGKPGHGYNEIRNTREFSPYRDDIIITGFVDNTELPYLMSGATLFLFPSLYEGFGIPVLEAQNTSVPVITSNTSSLHEVAGDGAYYVDPYSVDDIAQAMIRCVTDDELRSNLVENGKKNVERFDWSRTAQNVWEVISKSS